MDVVEKIARVKTNTMDQPIDNVQIIRAERIR